jgi:hypothetical protein
VTKPRECPVRPAYGMQDAAALVKVIEARLPRHGVRQQNEDEP